MLNRQQQFGQSGESMAARFLKKQRYKILETNYRTRQGEIDIIARDGAIAFTRSKPEPPLISAIPKGRDAPEAEEKIDTALQYLKQLGKAMPRPDVMWSASAPDRSAEIEIIKNAFDLPIK